MKKCFYLILCTVLLTSCTKIRTEEDARLLTTVTEDIDDTKLEKNLEIDANNLVTEGNGISLTLEEALEDYDYMWEVLENNYAYFGVANRLYGVSPEEIKKKYRDYILYFYESGADLIAYNRTLRACLSEFKGTAHLGFIDHDYWDVYKYALELDKEVLEDTSGLQFFIDPLIDEKTVLAYEYITGKSREEIVTNPENILSSNQHNLEFRLIDNDIAYMRINSFQHRYIANDHEKIMDFYHSIQDCKYLIIDITGNQGGSSFYWGNSIVSPNFNEKIEYDTVSFLKDGKENREYVEAAGFQIEPISAFDIESLENFNMEDYETLDSVARYKKIYQPINDKKLFEGEIYLLIDEKVYSSAEAFTLFCKETGFATIVGRNSRGCSSRVSPLPTSLPNSGLVFRYTNLYRINKDGSSNVEFGTTPDYICDEGETPLNTCLRIIRGK
ncbi:MAG: hypothetical protein GX962_01635 [Epulopiscium sp.]|nr:hypothetical protein [Candidatus Epulonipiscium sp.]